MRTNFVLCSEGERNRSTDIFHLPVETGTERNDSVPFHFWYHFFGRSIYWNGTLLFEVFPSECNTSASHFSEQYGTKRNDCVPV